LFVVVNEMGVGCTRPSRAEQQAMPNRAVMKRGSTDGVYGARLTARRSGLT
jgi:hypothetical protein